MTESTAVLRRVHDLLELLPETPVPRQAWPEETPEELAAWQHFLDTTENVAVEPCPFLDGVPDSLPRRRFSATDRTETEAPATVAEVAALPAVDLEPEVADQAVDVAEVGEAGEAPAVPVPPSPLVAALRRPRVVAMAAAALVVLLVVVAAATRRTDAVAVPVVSAPTTEAVASTTEAPPTTVAAAPAATAPAPPTTTPELARDAFLRAMTALGLTPAQGECVAIKVEATSGWDQLSTSAMTPESAQHLRNLVTACVNGE